MDLSKKKTYIFLYTVILFIIGLGLGCLFSGVMGSEVKVQPVFTPTPEPAPEPAETVETDETGGTGESGDTGELVEVEDFIYETKPENGQKWELQSKFMEVEEAEKLISVRDVTCFFYEEDMKKLKIVSEKGEINTENKDVRFDTKVVGTASTGETLEVDRLFWNGMEKKMLGEGNVIFIQENKTAKADKIRADLNFSTYRLEDNVVLINELDKEAEEELDKKEKKE